MLIELVCFLRVNLTLILVFFVTQFEREREREKERNQSKEDMDGSSKDRSEDLFVLLSFLACLTGLICLLVELMKDFGNLMLKVSFLLSVKSFYKVLSCLSQKSGKLAVFLGSFRPTKGFSLMLGGKES